MVVLITLAIAVVAGIYSFHYVRRATSRRIANRIYGVLSLAGLVYAGIDTLASPSFYTFLKALAVIIIFYACATLPLCLGALTEDVSRLFRRVFFHRQTQRPSRWIFYAACTLAAAGVCLVVEGMVRGKTDFRVYPFEMKSSRLPESFEGTRIVQISDLHLGSFPAGNEELPKAFAMIGELKPDIIVLTGDILNDNSADMLPWMGYLSSLKAPGGKYAIVGNHDYCEYDRSLSPEELEGQMDSLFSYYRRAGFKVLDNENVPIVRGRDTLYLAGVENWGLGPFPARGDLSDATKGIPAGKFTVLLSHDPAHFEKIVSEYPKFIDLTLSGHTHAMQFALRIGNFQWSPIQYRSPYWAGEYEKNGRVLYVNRGLGYHFFPARVGMRPEITLITLGRK